jgi:hypothetical protein
VKTNLAGNRIQIANWIKAENDAWLERHKANTRKDKGELLDEAIEALRRQYPESRKLNF